MYIDCIINVNQVVTAIKNETWILEKIPTCVRLRMTTTHSNKIFKELNQPNFSNEIAPKLSLAKQQHLPNIKNWNSEQSFNQIK